MGEDGKPYTTLGYSNGPGAIGPGPREDLTGWDTEDPTFRQQSTVKLRTETHGGEDVGKEVRNIDQYLKRSSVMSLLKKWQFESWNKKCKFQITFTIPSEKKKSNKKV